MATLIIDEVEVAFPDGTMILDAVEKAEIYILHFCSYPDFLL